MERKEAKTIIVYTTEEGAKTFQKAIKDRVEELYNKEMLETLKLNEELTVPILYGSGENREGNGILSQLEDIEKTRKRLLNKEVKYFKR